MSQDEMPQATKIKIDGFVALDPTVIQELAQSLGNMIYQEARMESTLFVLEPLLEGDLREQVARCSERMEDTKHVLRRLFRVVTEATIKASE